MYKKLIQHAMMSAADTCIIPIQDWLGLDNSGRMNTPGTVVNNWSWRLLPDQIPEELSEQMLVVTKRYGRANWTALNRLEEAAEETEEIA
jgi:4-alpha-glucanotransferase